MIFQYFDCINDKNKTEINILTDIDDKNISANDSHLGLSLIAKELLWPDDNMLCFVNNSGILTITNTKNPHILVHIFLFSLLLFFLFLQPFRVFLG